MLCAPFAGELAHLAQVGLAGAQIRPGVNVGSLIQGAAFRGLADHIAPFLPAGRHGRYNHKAAQQRPPLEVPAVVARKVTGRSIRARRL